MINKFRLLTISVFVLTSAIVLTMITLWDSSTKRNDLRNKLYPTYLNDLRTFSSVLRTNSSDPRTYSSDLRANVSELRTDSSYLRSRGKQLYESLIHSTPLSKDLVIHRVYIDDRERDGHKNQTMFFIDANWTIFENGWITGCGVNHQRALQHRISINGEWWGALCRTKRFVYDHLMVHCYDLPVKAGDRAFLIYKVNEFAPEYVIDANYPVIMPAPRVISIDSYNITVLTCLKANTKAAPFMHENLRYLKFIGVDHVSLIIVSSFIKDKGLWLLISKYPNIYHYIREGFVTVDTWKEWYNDNRMLKEHSESIRKVACVYNHRGTYDFAFPIDSDDFFNPRVPGETQMKFYLKRFCYENSIGSCAFKWLTYFPQYCGLKEIPNNGNVTAALKSYVYKKKTMRARVPKSIHKTQALLDATYHDALAHDKRNLMPGYIVAKVDPKFAYIAHNRVKDKPHGWWKC